MLDQLIKVNRSQGKAHQMSMLIPTWNNLPYIQQCVRSIRKNSALSLQIIILINEGKDGTLEWIQAQQDLDYVYSPSNLGICFGLNACRNLINTDYVVYLNDDMYVLPEWDKILFDEVGRIGHKSFIISGTAIEPNHTGNACVVVKNFGDGLENFQEDALLAEFESLHMPDWQGSTWPPTVMHVELWDLVGGMSVEFSPGMYSDPDLSMKLWQAGVRYFKGVGASKVYHFGSKSTKRIKRNIGRDIFVLKWGVTSNFLTKHMLRRGEPFDGPLNTPRKSSNIRHTLKRLAAAFSAR